MENNLVDWKNPPTLTDLKNNITDADIDQETHRANVDRWLKARTAKRKSNKNKSNVVPKVIRKQNEWRYSPLSEPFLDTPNLFTVSPTTGGDKKRALQNSLILNKQFNTQINKVYFFDTYVRSAVDLGTVIVKTGWETLTEEVEEEVPEFEYNKDITGELAQQYTNLLELRKTDQDGYAEYSNLGLDHALDVFESTGEAMFARQVGSKIVTTMRETKNQPTVHVCDDDNIIIDPSCEGVMSLAKFVGEKFKSSLSDLRVSGLYKNLDKIQIENNDILADADFNDSPDITAFSFKDEARKQFLVYTYWGDWDIDGTGITKQIVCSWVGNTIIRMELNPFPDRRPPFVLVRYMPVRSSLYGEPDAELLEDNQEIIGAVTRGTIDLLGKSANSQTGMRKDFLDITNKRRFNKNQNYEYNASADPRTAVYQHKFPEIPQSAFNMISMQNAEAESLTGIKAFSSGINGNSLGQVATGVRGALDAASKREISILRRLANGVIEIGYKIIAMNAVFLNEEEVVRITNDQFIPVRRDDLAGKFDLSLTISTAEEDNKKAEELSFMFQTTSQSMDFEFSKIILSDIARLRKMPALADRIEAYQQQPNEFEIAKQQKELQLLDAQIAKEQALTYKHTTEAEANGGRGAKDSAQAQLNLAKAGEATAKGNLHNADKDKKNLDYLHAANGTTHQQELDKIDRKADNAIIDDAFNNPK